MFDSHAHIKEIRDNCLVASSFPDEYQLLKRYKHRAYGLLFPKTNCSNILIEALENDKSGLCGEIGLDRRFRMECDIPFMSDMLSYLEESKRPFILHLVGRYDEMLRLLKAFKIDTPFMLHGFTGSYESALSFTRLGGTISLGPRSLKTRDISKLITLPFVLETDMEVSNEEQLVLERVYNEISILTGLAKEELESKVNKNISPFLQ